MSVTLFRLIQLIFEIITLIKITLINNYNSDVFLARNDIKMRRRRMDIFVYHFIHDIQPAVAFNLRTHRFIATGIMHGGIIECPIEHD